MLKSEITEALKGTGISQQIHAKQIKAFARLAQRDVLESLDKRFFIYVGSNRIEELEKDAKKTVTIVKQWEQRWRKRLSLR